MPIQFSLLVGCGGKNRVAGTARWRGRGTVNPNWARERVYDTVAHADGNELLVLRLENMMTVEVLGRVADPIAGAEEGLAGYARGKGLSWRKPWRVLWPPAYLFEAFGRTMGSQAKLSRLVASVVNGKGGTSQRMQDVLGGERGARRREREEPRAAQQRVTPTAPAAGAHGGKRGLDRSWSDGTIPGAPPPRAPAMVIPPVAARTGR